ncbi:MAG TPA: PqqD family protein [Casimicrobiaceae bacterium]|nr:PqqD family protein [Casimicrobiaceae bacterium]
MDWSLRPERAPGIEIREVSDGYVAYDAGRDRLHFLNATAMMLLELCDGRLQARELPELIAAAYRLSAPPAAEVGACLDQLLAEGLLIHAAPLAP